MTIFCKQTLREGCGEGKDATSCGTVTNPAANQGDRVKKTNDSDSLVVIKVNVVLPATSARFHCCSRVSSGRSRICRCLPC